MRRTLVLDVVGLTPSLLGEHTPALSAFAKAGVLRPLVPVLPAVTCSVQSTLLTGSLPRDHGAVGNGWYYRDIAEVNLWRQASSLVTGERVWDAAKARDPSFTCAQICWWYAMYASADYVVTPRPMYPADGRKLPDVWTHPAELRDLLQAHLGQFPLFDFWGPRSGIASSKWIAAAAIDVWRRREPTLALVYLPHLDYVLQREGPSGPTVARELRAIDAVCGDLIEVAQKDGARVIALSEYGITPVTGPVHINRVLREAGLIAVRHEMGSEQLDAGASEAFAVADHQVAHVYVKRAERVAEVQALLARTPGVDRVLDAAGKHDAGLDHARSGELVAVAAPDRWFTYYFWLDDVQAPDYARTVDIHRKPGYDPCELFFDPELPWPKGRAIRRLIQKKLGFRTLFDVVPLDPHLVKGSHGIPAQRFEDRPLLIGDGPPPSKSAVLDTTEVHKLLLEALVPEGA
jgi:predicted AlkP superfamily pyrophosphatase or phosphodiesterase